MLMGQDHTAQVKQWSEAKPKQFAPFDEYTILLASDKGWKRNHSMDGTGDVTPPDWSTASPAEFKLSTAGFLAVYGEMTDGKTYSDDNVVRKIGDLYLRARLRMRGIGTVDTTQDIVTFSNKLLKDERFLAEFKHKLGIDEKKIDGLRLSEEHVQMSRRDFVDMSPVQQVPDHFLSSRPSSRVDRKSTSNK